ncbi:MAG TPA: hypothetical protein V6D12_13610 [Candidatus Obscuribacterales bacterium]
MNQAELIQALGIADSTFRSWRSALGIQPKKQYDDSDIERFQALQNATSAGQRFDDAVRDITGEAPRQQTNGFVNAVKNGVGRQLNQQADMVGAGLAEAFQEQVYSSFLKHLSRGKFDRFEQLIESTNFALDGDDPLEAYLIEAGEDE